jgi:hypothetical protein
MKQHQKKMLNDYLENGDFSVRDEPFWVSPDLLEGGDEDYDDE